MSLEATKNKILASVSLVDLVQRTVTLSKKSGLNTGLCPFHPENTPSFTVYQDHYYCYGCQVRGDAITFVRETQGLGFIDALRHLANLYGLSVPELDKPIQSNGEFQKIAQIYRALREAQSYFRHNLNMARAEDLRGYLTTRQLSPEDCEQFEIGLSLPNPDALSKHLHGMGFSGEILKQASLINQSERTRRNYDFFQDRLMIPIHDGQGRIIGFGGRTWKPSDAVKYKNSRESPVFNKSQTIFGLHRARQAIRRVNRAFIVEGYMDVFQMCKNGFTETVACLGTALTEQHLQMISQVTSRLYLVFDGDKAGQQATLKTVTLALKVPSLAIRVVALPEGVDPDSLLGKAQGKQLMTTMIEQAPELFEHTITHLLQTTNTLGIPDLVKKTISPWLQSIGNSVQSSFLRAKISQMTGINLVDLAGNHLPQQGHAKLEVLRDPNFCARSLSQVEYELIGQLFYSKPGEFSVDAVKDAIGKYLEIDDKWMGFCQELLAKLGEKISPATTTAKDWDATLDAQVLTNFEKWRSTPGAFDCENRVEKIATILCRLEETELKKTINHLKKQLALTNTPDTDQRLRLTLAGIAKVNQALRELNPKDFYQQLEPVKDQEGYDFT